MLRSLYIATTGMLVQRKKMDVITNNVANIETNGYKKDRLLSRSFQDMMIQRIGDPAIISMSTTVGAQNTGVHIDEITIDFTQGSMENTERLSDLALQGSGYFVVSTPNGDRYTRDGSFAVSSDGYLVSGDGYPIMGTNGRIQVGNGKFAIDDQGNVTVDGKITNKLRIAAFADETGLRKTGFNLFINYTNQAVGTPAGTTVKQGYLEGSNVDMATEMVEMMEVSRTYDTNQRMVKMLDESLGKAVNEVGRV